MDMPKPEQTLTVVHTLTEIILPVFRALGDFIDQLTTIQPEGARLQSKEARQPTDSARESRTDQEQQLLTPTSPRMSHATYGTQLSYLFKSLNKIVL
jgi:hypothetical protein